MNPYQYNQHGKNFGYYKKPLWKTKKFYLILLIILAIGFFVYRSIENAESTAAVSQTGEESDTIPSLTAKVAFLKNGIQAKSEVGEWRALAVNQEIKAGELLKTGSNAQTTIELPDKSLIRLAENTEVRLTTLTMNDIVIEQLSGNAYHRVNDNSFAIYRVKNGRSEILSLGTAFNTLVSGDLTIVTVVENKIKAKVFSNASEEILNMRTVNAGTKAMINPLKNENIEIEDVSANELLQDPWFVWNLEKDKELKQSLGIFANVLLLKITEPAQSAITITDDKIKIKGETDPGAKIYLLGKEITPQNGRFETEVTLNHGENIIDILAKKEKEEITKTITVNSQKENDNIKLSGTNAGGQVTLSWTIEAKAEYDSIRTVKSDKPNPSYPGADSHALAKSASQDNWANLTDGKYYFRLCLIKGDKCVSYSNNFSVDATTSKTIKNSPIKLSGRVENGKVFLNWTTDEEADKADSVRTIQAAQSGQNDNSHDLNITSHSDIWNGLAAGKQFFRVCAVIKDACAQYSDEIIITIP